MADRKKVIKGLEHCSEMQTCFGCPYYKCDPTCQDDLCKDALSMLKEQKAEWIEYPECLAYDGAYSDSHIVCSACKHVFDIMDNCTEEFDYCPHCGAKMKQEGR